MKEMGEVIMKVKGVQNIADKEPFHTPFMRNEQ